MTQGDLAYTGNDSASRVKTSGIMLFRAIGGTVAVLTLVIIIIYWSWSPAYKILFSSLDDQDAASVLNVLYSNGFDARLDDRTGAILVPANEIHFARIKLSNHGISAAHNLNPDLYLGKIDHGMDIHNHQFSKGNAINFQKLEDILSQRIERLLEPLTGTDSVRVHVRVNKKTGVNQDFKTRPESSLSNNNLPPAKELPSQGGGKTPVYLTEGNSLSVMVLVDYKNSDSGGGKVRKIARSKEEMNNLTEIVNQVIGFNSLRGDSVKIVNVKFTGPPDSSLNNQNKLGLLWHQETVRKIAGLVISALLIFFMLWYFYKNYKDTWAKEGKILDTNEEKHSYLPDPAETAIKNYDANYKQANLLVKHDPKLAAQIIKNWVGADG